MNFKSYLISPNFKINVLTIFETFSEFTVLSLITDISQDEYDKSEIKNASLKAQETTYEQI